jgi:hypothetical protein
MPPAEILTAPVNELAVFVRRRLVVPVLVRVPTVPDRMPDIVVSADVVTVKLLFRL